MENPETIGQGVGALFMILAAAYAVIKGHRKSDGNPPAERPPAPHEVKQAISSLSSQIERAAMDDAMSQQLLKAIGKLIVALEAAAAALDTNTEMSSDMRGDIRDVSRDLRSLVTELLRAQIGGGKR